MAEVTQTMTEAQGEEINSVDVSAEGLAERIADYLGFPRDMAVSALQMARDAQNLRVDSNSAFGTRFCDVSDWRALNFDACATYIHQHYDGFLMEPQAVALAIATVAEGMSGHGAEDAIIEHFDWMTDAPSSLENDGIDAFAGDVKLQIKRNDRTQNRHNHFGLAEDVILVSWAEMDNGGIRVSFEDHTGNIIGHSVARGV